MSSQAQLNYHRIAAAISYLHENFRRQPSLEEVAEKVHLSPFHFQRLFSEWAGVSPKKFLQYISVEYAKSLLQEAPSPSLFDTAHATGLSGTSRLHDLFITIEGMTPGTYKDGGKELRIRYDFQESPFGTLLVASTSVGICHISFVDREDDSARALQDRFPQATLEQAGVPMHEEVLQFFSDDWRNLRQVRLHLKGSTFQLKVWEALLKIPAGKLSTYGAIAGSVGNPAASRAVGTAIGSNPVAYLIPCHRVIQASGAIGGYMWGSTRKTAIIGWEAAHNNSASE